MVNMKTRSALDIDQMPVALLQINMRRKIVGMNSAAESVLGISRQAARERKLSELLYHDCALFDLVDKAEETQSKVSAFAVQLNGPGFGRPKEQYASVSLTPENDFSIALLNASASDQNNAEIAGLAAFGRILGHEVKNPLAGISGATQLLLRQARPDQNELLDLVLSETERITRLVDKLSAFELFSAPRRISCNIHQVLDQVIRAEDVAFEGSVRFKRNFDPSLPNLLADADHLHEAFQNIVRNAAEAIRMSSTGGTIHVNTRFALDRGIDRLGKQGFMRSLKVVIADDGPGISRKDCMRIFDMFQTTKSNGSGLGLTVASQVIAAHDGTIKLDSQPGDTRFSIYLPIMSEA